MRSLLRKVSRGEIDGDHLGRKREADRGKRRANTLSALRDGLVRQANDGELRHARSELHLHLDGAGFEAEIRDSGDGRGHQAASPERNTLRKHPPSSAGRS
jgi:hypothetical protein